MAEKRTIAEMIVELKAEGAEGTQQELEDVQDEARKGGKQMESLSKRWGIAFKAAGLFAAGLFGSILKGGPVTAAFMSNIWQSIGNLGDTLLQKAGAWEILGEINRDINNINMSARENDALGFFESLGSILATGIQVGTGIDIKGMLATAEEEYKNHTIWEGIKTRWLEAFGEGGTVPTALALASEGFDSFLTNLKTTFTNTMTSLKTKARTAFDRIKFFIGNSMDIASTLARTAMDRIGSAWETLKTRIENNPIVQTITTVTRSIAEGVKSILKRQSGGFTQARQPFIVGERGPELFTPNTSGRITPNGGLGGLGGGNVTVQITVQGGVYGDVRALADEVGRQFTARMGGLGR